MSNCFARANNCFARANKTSFFLHRAFSLAFFSKAVQENLACTVTASEPRFGV